MSNPKMGAYRVAVAVVFGLIGFGLNFLDIQFIEGATFKISILAGLFFPLVVVLAWGLATVYGAVKQNSGGMKLSAPATPLKDLIDSPSLFPFQIKSVHAESLVAASSRLEVLRHGLDDVLVMLRKQPPKGSL